MKLTGLHPNNPVAVMSAYGALRLLSGARIRWLGPHPEIEFEGDIVTHLVEQLPERLLAPENTLLDDVIDGPALIGKIPDEWLMAYAGQCPPEDGGTGRKARMHNAGWTPTDLLLLGGRHLFVANARKIMEQLARQNVRDKVAEALVGPWRYEDAGLQAWGWDAATRIDAASAVDEVTKAPKFGVFGAYWLAWESLPLWPMINGRTVGMNRSGWTYPTCQEWLGLEGLRSLILAEDRLGPREVVALGVTRWHSPKLRPSDYGSVLGWAQPEKREPKATAE